MRTDNGDDQRERWPHSRGQATLVVLIALLLVTLFILAKNILEKAAIAQARADIDRISLALTDFFNDLGNFPSCDSADCDPLNDAANNLRFLAVGVEAGDPAKALPTDTAGLWNLGLNGSATPARNNAYNHLVVNNPNADEIPNDSGKDYRPSQWKGPYTSQLGLDPFGRAYIIHVGAMQKRGCPVNTAGGGCGRAGRGWILSAGPNGNLETAPNANWLSGDDIGYILFSSK